MGEDGNPIDLMAMPRQHRRRREKKLMSMDEVNERFPLTKYKTWRSTRAEQGLPTEGGVAAASSRPASIRNSEIKDSTGDVTSERRASHESHRPQPPTNTIELAQQDHINASDPTNITTEVSKEEQVAGQSESIAPASVPREPALVEGTSEKVAGPAEPETEQFRNVSVGEESEHDDDDPITTAAPPEMLAVAGDTCAICIDTLEDEDEVRGLTCGHAFHAACVDPWLTARRACCPLCKADYYVPKPRNEGDADDATARQMPQTPGSVWLGGRRRGTAQQRARTILLGPRVLMLDTPRPGPFGYRVPPRPTGAERRATEGTMHEEPQAQGSWRSRLPAAPRVRLPGFGRRRGDETVTGAGDAAATTTPSSLEAGTANVATNAATTTTSTAV